MIHTYDSHLGSARECEAPPAYPNRSLFVYILAGEAAAAQAGTGEVRLWMIDGRLDGRLDDQLDDRWSA